MTEAHLMKAIKNVYRAMPKKERKKAILSYMKKSKESAAFVKETFPEFYKEAKDGAVLGGRKKRKVQSGKSRRA